MVDDAVRQHMALIDRPSHVAVHGQNFLLSRHADDGFGPDVSFLDSIWQTGYAA
jgi:hypothetical protein